MSWNQSELIKLKEDALAFGIQLDEEMTTSVGDEGGFAPDFDSVKDVFRMLGRAVELAGYRVGEDVVYAMDAAASELYDETLGVYRFPGERQREKETDGCGVMRSTDEMIALYEELAAEFPLVSIEDGLSEDDWDGWQKLTQRLGFRPVL